MLSEIAFKSFSEDRLFLREEDLVGEISCFLNSTLGAPEHLDGKGVLDAIEMQQGILVKRIERIYSFSHLTIQEYLTARYIAQQTEHISELVDKHLMDERWSEVFILISGLIDLGDYFLKQMYTRIQMLSLPPALFVWSEDATKSFREEIQASIKRSFAISLALHLAAARNVVIEGDRSNARDRARDLAQDLTRDRARDLAQDLARAQNLQPTIPHDPKQDRSQALINVLDLALAFVISIEQNGFLATTDHKEIISRLNSIQLQVNQEEIIDHKEYLNKHLMIIELLIDYLRLDVEVIDSMTSLNFQNISAYFRAVRLLINCKNSCIRVSPKVWKTIEEQLLLVEDAS